METAVRLQRSIILTHRLHVKLEHFEHVGGDVGEVGVEAPIRGEVADDDRPYWSGPAHNARDKRAERGLEINMTVMVAQLTNIYNNNGSHVLKIVWSH